MQEAYREMNRLMKKKVVNYRLIALQLILVLLFCLFLIFLFLPKSYTRKYKIDEVEVFEAYNKKDKRYYFTFKIDGKNLDYLSEVKYSKSRKLISKIDIIKDENDNFCLIPKGKKIDFKPLCMENGNSIYYALVNEKLKEGISKYLKQENKLIETWNDYEIYSKDYIYLLWNYDGFYYINKDTKKKIKILDKEMYSINGVGYTEDYLVVPDYTSDYTFNNYYTIDFKNGNLKKQKIDRNVYFDSYFIGYEKNKAYIVDNKETVMYEFDAKKGKIEIIKAKVLNKGSWENANIKTLLNKKEEFSYKTNYNYTFSDNRIYLNYKNSEIKKLIACDVTSVVRIKDKDIYYLKDNTLYHFNEDTGEEKLLTHFEWNFNTNNMIYINSPF